MSDLRILIVGGGPVGLAFALMLARRQVRSDVLDARTVEAAKADRRLLALSHGTLDLLSPLVGLPPVATPIRRVVVSSAGEFGRVVLGPEDAPVPLGLTVRYGDLLTPLAAACEASPFISVRRPRRVAGVSQRPAEVAARLDDGEECKAALMVDAEGTHGQNDAPDQAALVADVVVDGPAEGEAFERFTREGPLALLPAGSMTAAGRGMALVWCMPAAASERRLQLEDAGFVAELQQAFGKRSGRIVKIGPRVGYPLHQQARDTVCEHRVVWIGNAAQTLHPVAGQGLNLGMRDAAQLADEIARVVSVGDDPAAALAGYRKKRRADRAAILGLTRRAPGLFATRAAPVAAGRVLALALLNAVPDLRREFARLLMFGVRS
jgi:2-octaprenyl-6-methoxyphenol hydroxylase